MREPHPSEDGFVDLVLKLDLVLVPRQEVVAGLAVANLSRPPVAKVTHLDFESKSAMDVFLVLLVATCLSLRSLARPDWATVEAPAAHAGWVQTAGRAGREVARHGNAEQKSCRTETTRLHKIEQKCAKSNFTRNN